MESMYIFSLVYKPLVGMGGEISWKVAFSTGNILFIYLVTMFEPGIS